MAKNQALTNDVENWWNDNPFAFGVSNTEGDQVGTIPFEEMDLAYFEEVERRFRKHHRDAAQDAGEPLFSKIVDLDSLKGKKVLDIAVGSGFSMVPFIEAGADVTGIDLTNFGVKHATRNLEIRGLPGTVKKMDAQELQFPDESFDFVNAWGCFMHMPDTEGAIKEACRVLKPGGKLMAYMYNKKSWPYWFNIYFVRGILMLGLIRYQGDTVKLSSRYSDGYTRGGNARTEFYNPEDVDVMLKNAGFTTYKTDPWVLRHAPDQWPMRSIPIFRYLPDSIKFRMARYGYGLIVHAQK